MTNVEEAVQWLSYTYLHIRMLLNPQAYGIPLKRKEVWSHCTLYSRRPPISPLLSQDDPQLELHRRELIIAAATILDRARMIRYHEPTGTLHSTDLGRTASHFYIKHVSIEVNYSNNHLIKTYNLIHCGTCAFAVYSCDLQHFIPL